MMNWLIAEFWPYILGGLTIAASALAVFFKGKKVQEQKHLKKQLQKERKGRNAVAKEKAETAGANRRTLVDRLRSRDGDWGGL